MYSDLIQSVQREIAEAKERIAEYAYQLEKAAIARLLIMSSRETPM